MNSKPFSSVFVRIMIQMSAIEFDVDNSISVCCFFCLSKTKVDYCCEYDYGIRFLFLTLYEMFFWFEAEFIM